jgi:hypothetical protein
MWSIAMPPAELLVLYGTWIIGFALIGLLVDD